MNFLPISMIAYFLVAGAVVVDKILLKRSVPSPLVYTIYVNLLQLFVVFLIPLGFILEGSQATYLAIVSGLVSFFALYAFFHSLKLHEASLVSPLVGAFNPLFALMIEWLFLGQVLNIAQYLAILVLIIGTIVFTHNQWAHHFRLNRSLSWIIISGLLFAVSFVLLRQALLQTSFINGLVVSRLAAGLLAGSLLIMPNIRRQVLEHHRGSPLTSRSVLALMIAGQIMGGASGLLIVFGITLASASLVNSLFGIQYLAILVISLILVKKHPHLLDENLTKKTIIQKIFGAVIISIGLYLLAK